MTDFAKGMRDMTSVINRLLGDAAPDWEARVRALEEEGCTRSDAQAIVDAEDQREKP